MAVAMLHLILLYARQLLSRESDIEVEEEVGSSAEVQVKEMEANEMRKRLNVWEVLEVLPPMQTLPPHILCNLSMYFGKKELLQNARRISANHWSGKWLTRPNIYDVISLLAVDCGAGGIFMNRSTILREDSRQ